MILGGTGRDGKREKIDVQPVVGIGARSKGRQVLDLGDSGGRVGVEDKRAVCGNTAALKHGPVGSIESGEIIRVSGDWASAGGTGGGFEVA